MEKNEMGGACSRYGEGRGGLFWKPEERDSLEDSGVDGVIILRWVFRKWVGGVWAGLIWLRLGTGGGLL